MLFASAETPRRSSMPRGRRRATTRLRGRSTCTSNGWGKLASAMLTLLAADAAIEGRKVIVGMLIVGLVFVSVIALGQLSYWLRHRRR